MAHSKVVGVAYLTGHTTYNIYILAPALVHHYKYLSVWLSDNLSWEKHIQYVSNKARRHLDFRTFSPFCSPVSLVHLYRTQVLPLLDYGCILWDPHLSKHKQQLEKMQLFATRMVSKQWNESAETCTQWSL